MAHMVFQNMINEKGLECEFEIDSAGTEGYNEMCHAGIHRGTKEILRRKGIPFEEHYSRKIRKKDYEYYDYIIAMDKFNLRNMTRFVGDDPQKKVSLLLDHTDCPGDVADPWYTDDFDKTWEDVNRGCRGLLDEIGI